jgi:hypothetical protein
VEARVGATTDKAWEDVTPCTPARSRAGLGPVPTAVERGGGIIASTTAVAEERAMRCDGGVSPHCRVKVMVVAVVLS